MGVLPYKLPLIVVLEQIGVADSKYVVLDDPYNPVTWHGARALPILPLKWSIHIAFIHYSATDQAKSIRFGNKYA